jgi:hypothetical protein
MYTMSNDQIKIINISIPSDIHHFCMLETFKILLISFGSIMSTKGPCVKELVYSLVLLGHEKFSVVGPSGRGLEACPLKGIMKLRFLSLFHFLR